MGRRKPGGRAGARLSLLSLWLACLGLALALTGGSGKPRSAGAAEEPRSAAPLRFAVEPDFVDFRHEKGDGGRRYIVETMGSGCALFDFDADGDLDLYLIQGAPLPGSSAKGLVNQLYRNRGDGNFERVEGDAGLGDAGYGMGVAVGDIDNDGDPDLYLTQFGPDRLFRNDGGAFTDVTEAAGLGCPDWGASAAFADLDGDGDLDLYVTNYLRFTIATHQECTLGKGIPAYCSPDAYPGVPDRVYRNEGDGRFTDVTKEVGLLEHDGKGLGVACADFDLDGRIDIYVANDGVANQVLMNRGGWKFEDTTLISGVGFNEEGMAQAGMGIVAGDLTGHGRTDLFVTNLSAETNVFYRSEGDGFFADATLASRLGAPSLLYTGFGTVAGDHDRDGDLDLFVTNGHVIDNIALFNDHQTYEQPDQLFRQERGVFEEVTGAAFRPTPPLRAGRGAVQGDIDGDGDLDVIVTSCDEGPILYRNVTATDGHWLQVSLRGTLSNRDGIGARLELHADGRRMFREVCGGGSYLSASAAPVHFGFGAAEPERLVVRWPSGKIQTIDEPGADRRLELVEPKGE